MDIIITLFSSLSKKRFMNSILCYVSVGIIVYADISMLDKVMVFDNEKQLIGWGPADCNSIPKSRDFSL
jgi:hypothetical protein